MFVIMGVMRFRFLATDPNGQPIKGEIVADSKRAAEQNLSEQNLQIQFLQFYDREEEGNRTSLKPWKRMLGKPLSAARWKYDFFEQLGMLLAAHLPLERCLTVLSSGRSNCGTAQIMGLREKIYAGLSLSEAMKCSEGIFSDVEIQTVKASEEVGRPALALEKLSEYGKRIQSLKNKVKSAMVYPAIVLSVACGALILLMAVVVPKLEAIFASESSFDKSLPWLTRQVINFCNFFSNNWLLLVLFITIIGIVGKFAVAQSKVRGKIFAFLTKIPLVGKIYLDINLNNFFQTMGMLMSFGTSLQESLVIATKVVKNRKLKNLLAQVSEKISHGEKFAEALCRHGVMGSVSQGMVIAGEESGSLTQSFLKIADLYKDKIASHLALLTALIEPTIIIFLSIVVGIVVVAMFLPMIGLMQSIKI